jgi:hypothetical protein
VVGAAAAVTSLPAHQCFKMLASKRWTGLWRNEFERSWFCPPPARECSSNTTGEKAWLEFSSSLPAHWKGLRPGGLYAVDFIGRRTAYGSGDGRVGGITFDRMISIKELEPPPKVPADGPLK